MFFDSLSISGHENNGKFIDRWRWQLPIYDRETWTFVPPIYRVDIECAFNSVCMAIIMDQVRYGSTLRWNNVSIMREIFQPLHFLQKTDALETNSLALVNTQRHGRRRTNGGDEQISLRNFKLSAAANAKTWQRSEGEKLFANKKKLPPLIV